MTILAEHISEGGLTQIAYQQEPNQIVYATRNDGELVALTYQREQQVTAWHRHIFGGRFGNATITVTDFANIADGTRIVLTKACLLYTSPSPRDGLLSRMPSSA